ncbi:unnamed protein product, partial [marine sediment metagenome]
EYDQLMRDLIELEEKYPQYITPSSPTQRVGIEPVSGFTTVKHIAPMLSLANAFSPEELRAFDQRVKKIIPQQKLEYVVELKIDGLAVTLVSEDDIFTRGATRGDGTTGEEITSNLRTVKAIPLKLFGEDNPPRIEVYGEVYMKKSDFKKLNKERTKRVAKSFTNEEYEIEKFNEGNREFNSSREFAYKVMAEFFAGIFFLSNILIFQ